MFVFEVHDTVILVKHNFYMMFEREDKQTKDLHFTIEYFPLTRIVYVQDQSMSGNAAVFCAAVELVANLKCWTSAPC